MRHSTQAPNLLVPLTLPSKREHWLHPRMPLAALEQAGNCLSRKVCSKKSPSCTCPSPASTRGKALGLRVSRCVYAHTWTISRQRLPHFSRIIEQKSCRAGGRECESRKALSTSLNARMAAAAAHKRRTSQASAAVRRQRWRPKRAPARLHSEYQHDWRGGRVVLLKPRGSGQCLHHPRTRLPLKNASTPSSPRSGRTAPVQRNPINKISPARTKSACVQHGPLTA